MNKLIVSSSPHIKTKNDTPRIMLDVVIALIPLVAAAAVHFGFGSLIVIALCVATCIVSEFVFNLAVKKEQTICDLSAVITGLVLGLALHNSTQIWECIIASIFAIVVVKNVFGGLGCNFANPAATAVVFVLVCFEAARKGATSTRPAIAEMFVGDKVGEICVICIAALALGFIYLVARRVIKFEVPVIMIGIVFVLYLLTGNNVNEALYLTLTGGLVFAAVFMASDYATTPVTRVGKMVFALGCGLLTFLIRSYGNSSYGDGVYFAVLFMNILSPYIENMTKPVALGKRGNK